mmetsp:Transcript_157878/g.274070  ORF Transcript_157878/g.274070 Transcript_157878/m.274070 type:complete len:208 (-) Transcript_157878:260-883(-)
MMPPTQICRTWIPLRRTLTSSHLHPRSAVAAEIDAAERAGGAGVQPVVQDFVMQQHVTRLMRSLPRPVVLQAFPQVGMLCFSVIWGCSLLLLQVDARQSPRCQPCQQTPEAHLVIQQSELMQIQTQAQATLPAQAVMHLHEFPRHNQCPTHPKKPCSRHAVEFHVPKQTYVPVYHQLGFRALQLRLMDLAQSFSSHLAMLGQPLRGV